MQTNRPIVGVDTAKRVFQLYWVDVETGEEMNVRLSRTKFLRHFANHVPCLVAMEACASAEHLSSRARHREELVTDDRDRLRERLEGARGERIAALESVEPGPEKQPDPGREAEREQGSIKDPGVEEFPVPEMGTIQEGKAPGLEL